MSGSHVEALVALTSSLADRDDLPLLEMRQPMAAVPS
jgi:hypothetical protein